MKIYFIGSIPGHEPSTGQVADPSHHALFNAADAIGYRAAERGHTILISGDSQNTIDFYVMQGVERLSAERPDKQFCVEIHRPERERSVFPVVAENLTISRVVYRGDASGPFKWIVTHVRALDSCDVVVAIGGGNSTRVVGTIAAERNVPLLAMAVFGGSASELYEQLKYVYRNTYGVTQGLDCLTQDWRAAAALDVVGLAESMRRPSGHRLPHSYFISYSWDDRDKADHLEALLRRNNRIVLRDEHNVKAGGRLSDGIVALIDEAETFIVLYSAKYASSSWCPHELEHALNNQSKSKKPGRIVLLALDDTKPPLRVVDSLRLDGRTRGARQGVVYRLLDDEP
jgi:hypothetical protein